MAQKILHILTGMARGGCEGNAMCMIRQTPECEHHLLVLGTTGDMSADFASACSRVLYCQPLKWPWSLSCLVRQHVTTLAPDGVIVWHGMVMLPQILHALRVAGIPVLVHGGNPAHSMPGHVDLRYWMLEKMLGQRAVATYACCSRYVVDSFRGSRYLRRFPAVVVPNGIRPLTVPLHEPEKGMSGHVTTLGMVARLDRIKDHATLLRAFAVALQEHPKLQLELVGDGECRIELEALASDLGISSRTRFLGQVEDPYQVMQTWGMFVYATTACEGLGNALAEAMMLGLPCVATQVGPIGEVAGSPPCVLLVEAGDAHKLAEGISRLISLEPLRHELSQAGRHRARKEFSAEVFAHRYLDLLMGGRS